MLETPLVRKYWKYVEKKSLDVFGYDLFFLENPSSSRKKCHARDSEKVDRHTITDSIYTL